MNGKHPIDDLFARSLRDAEATPPPAVWEGIVRERGMARPAPADGTAKTRSRGRWGLAALLLLLMGAAGYWAVSPERTGAAAGHVTEQSSPGGEGKAGNVGARQMDTEQGLPRPNDASGQPVITDRTNRQVVKQKEPVTSYDAKAPIAQRAGAAANREAPAKKDLNAARPDGRTGPQPAKPVTTASASSSGRLHAGPKGNTSRPAVNKVKGDEPGSGSANDAPPDPTSELPVVSNGAQGVKIHEAVSDPMAQSSTGSTSRTTSDVHLPKLASLVTPFANNAAWPPGPILKGDSAAAYVISKGHWWIALHAEGSLLDGEWRGSGREVSELNAGETWLDQKGFGIVAGRSWLDRWAVGLGLSATRQRSRFLRSEMEGGQVETVVDTTWIATPMGMQTNYTWDIVETLVVEPGVARDLSATNTYTRLRIAPEVIYELLGKKRTSLSARLAPLMMLDLGRKGRTVVPVTTTGTPETNTLTTGTLALENASLDERFPAAFAIAFSLEASYRLHERWALSVLPTYTYWLPRNEGAVPVLSMNELGGALRLRYDLRHQERRKK